jgi:hypothetical protein
MSEQNPNADQSIPSTASSPKRRSLLQQVGCSIGILFWIILLLTPCLCLTLASQGEIAIRLGDIPGQSLRVWLVNESRERGISIAWPVLHSRENSDNVCLQTDVRFVLWMGQGNATSYCDCYTRSDDQWTLISTNSGVCPSE